MARPPGADFQKFNFSNRRVRLHTYVCRLTREPSGAHDTFSSDPRADETTQIRACVYARLFFFSSCSCAGVVLQGIGERKRRENVRASERCDRRDLLPLVGRGCREHLR